MRFVKIKEPITMSAAVAVAIVAGLIGLFFGGFGFQALQKAFADPLPICVGQK